MKKYKKILTAKNSPQNNCLAPTGDILITASEKDKFSGFLENDTHYFVSLKNREQALFGWVSELKSEITALDLAIMDYKSINKKEPSDLSLFSDEKLYKYQMYLDQINKYLIDTPIACHYFEKKDKNNIIYKELLCHKVMFYIGKS